MTGVSAAKSSTTLKSRCKISTKILKYTLGINERYDNNSYLMYKPALSLQKTPTPLSTFLISAEVIYSTEHTNFNILMEEKPEVTPCPSPPSKQTSSPRELHALAWGPGSPISQFLRNRPVRANKQEKYQQTESYFVLSNVRC